MTKFTTYSYIEVKITNANTANLFKALSTQC